MDQELEEIENIDSQNYEENFFKSVQAGKDYQHFMNIGSQNDCMFIRSMLYSMGIPTYIEGDKMNMIYGTTANLLTSLFNIKLYILVDDYDEALEVAIDYMKNKVERLAERDGKDKYLGILELLGAPYQISPSQELLGMTIFNKKVKEEKVSFWTRLKRFFSTKDYE